MKKPATEETPLTGYQGIDVENQDDATFEDVQDVDLVRSSRPRLVLVMALLTGTAMVAGFNRGLRGESAEVLGSTANNLFNWNSPPTVTRNYTEVTWTPSGVKNVTLPDTEGGPETVAQAISRIKTAQYNLEVEQHGLQKEEGTLDSTYQGQLNMQETALRAKLEQELEQREQSLQRTYAQELKSKYEELNSQMQQLTAQKQSLAAKQDQLEANQEDLGFHNQYYNHLQSNSAAVATQEHQLQDNQYGDLDTIDKSTPSINFPSSKYLNNFEYHNLKNSPGSNFKHSKGSMDDIAAECISNPTCAGFNTNGLMKNNLLKPDQWTKAAPNGDPVQGLFARSGNNPTSYP